MNRSKMTTDHDQIRRWAEARGGQPAAVKGTSRGKADPGMIRIDFPGYSGKGKLEPISWDEWFDKFDDSNLALIFQDKTARGQKSNFNKLISRDTMEEAESSRKGSPNGRRARSRRTNGHARTTARSARGQSARSSRSSARSGKSSTRSARTGRATSAKTSTRTTRSAHSTRSARPAQRTSAQRSAARSNRAKRSSSRARAARSARK